MPIENEYSIKIYLTPHTWDSPELPYFWVVLKNGCNFGSGWSNTPTNAWKEALEYYNTISLGI